MASGVRHDWYQTETHVVVTLLVKNIDQNTFKIKITSNVLEVRYVTPASEEEQVLVLNLAHPVKEDDYNFKVYSTKVEIKLKKIEGIRWSVLEGEDKIQTDEPPKYPSSSLKSKDWDKVKVEDDEPEGEAALNALFSKIYSEGSDEVRKAMNKSFQESGGTVLSTNWNDVQKEKVDVKPPEGLEFKKWE